VARDAVAAALTVFGPRLVSAYLIGSLAHEGFVAAVSDIDIAVIVEGDDPGTPHASRRSRAESWSRPARRWPNACRCSGPPPTPCAAGNRTVRLPAIDWLDLIDSGELVHGAALPMNTPDPPPNSSSKTRRRSRCANGATTLTGTCWTRRV